jgi:UDP-N-acetylmuramoyl-tripeptide--D-alanyl-D-alanine ligase
LQLGQYSEAGHKQVGEAVAKTADILIAVGSQAKLISSEAIANKFLKENIFEFENSQQAGQKLQEIIKPGDIILIKGSRAMAMEKAVFEIMAEPEKAKKLLVH